MNTLALPDISIPLPATPTQASYDVVDLLRPVLWKLSFENGFTVSSERVTWNEIAMLQPLDTLTLPFTWGNIEVLEVSYHGQCVVLRSPAPMPFFGLTRLAQGIVEASPTWVGSLFGYALPEYVVCLAITPQGMRVTTHPRPLTSFTLL